MDINPSISGISGDMFSAALLGLIDVPKRREILNEIRGKLQDVSTTFDVKLIDNSFQGIQGFNLELNNEISRIDASQLPEMINSLCHQFNIEDKYLEFAQNTIRYLLEAEKEVHQKEDIHLHELGTIDTVFDLIVPAYLLSYLEISTVILHPINTGRGTVNTAHGILPVPAPATQYILQEASLETIATVDGEATTPTGAAILASIRKVFKEPYSVIWEHNSYGFGSKQFPNRGNMLRVRTGRETEEVQQIEILETNLDDISGEFMGYAVQELLDYGALDVSYYPIVMKKNRPGYTLRVLAKPEDSNRIGEYIQRLTGTLGIRVMKIDRHLGERSVMLKTIYVEEWNEIINIRMKKGFRHKFEFDDLVRLGNKFDMTPLEVQDILFQSLGKSEENT